MENQTDTACKVYGFRDRVSTFFQHGFGECENMMSAIRKTDQHQDPINMIDGDVSLSLDCEEIGIILGRYCNRVEREYPEAI